MSVHGNFTAGPLPNTGRVNFMACECCYSPLRRPDYIHRCGDRTCPARPFVLYLHNSPDGATNFAPWQRWRELTDSICTDTWRVTAGKETR